MATDCSDAEQSDAASGSGTINMVAGGILERHPDYIDVLRVLHGARDSERFFE